MQPFHILKTSETLTVFWYFQEVLKICIGSKSVNTKLNVYSYIIFAVLAQNFENFMIILHVFEKHSDMVVSLNRHSLYHKSLILGKGVKPFKMRKNIKIFIRQL